MFLEDRIRLPALSLIQRRPRLLNSLIGYVESGYRLITIYAPGGYGKSILLADFAQTINLPVCWCSLEPADRDPTSFLTLLAYSVLDRFHELEPQSLLKLVERGDTHTTVSRIAELLSSVGPHLLIIDDYHKAVSAGMSLVLNRLLERLPDDSTVIVAARGEMNLETGQIIELLLDERATGLSEEELRFTPEEVQLVMRKRFGRQIDSATAQQIVQATDGNVAQILLTGHMMHPGPLLASLEPLGTDRDMIYDYLAGEVFDKQPPDLQQFMLFTSILPDMTAELCNDLLAIDDAHDRLELLVRKDLFVTHLGAGYKYHDLFARFLRNKLAGEPELYRQTSLHAAGLLAARSRFEEAVNTYLSVQAWDEAAAILETNGRYFYDTGRALTLNNWLSQIAGTELERRPRLLLLRGQILNNNLGEPKLAIQFYRRAEEKFMEQNSLTGAAEAQILHASALRMMGHPQEGLALAISGFNQLEALQADSYLMAWATRYRGLGHAAVGNMNEALADLRQALELFKAQHDVYNEGMCHHDIGVALTTVGNLSGAEHHYTQAVRIWEALGNANDLANTLNSLGVSAYYKGHYAEAAERFQESLNIAFQIGATRRIAFAQAGIGDAQLAQKAYNKAVKAYQLSGEFAREAGVRSLEIYNRVKMGECFYQQDNLDQALKLASQAREMAGEMGLSFEQGLACALQARVYVRRAEYEDSFTLFATALARLAGSDVVEQARVRLWWARGLLIDLRAAAAFQQLEEGIKLVLGMGELIAGLEPTVVETEGMLLHFLHRDDTPQGVRDNIHLLLAAGPERLKPDHHSLQVFAFGPPVLVINGEKRQFTQRGGVRKAPEFLLYLILAGRVGGSRWSEVCSVLWPDMTPQKASVNFHQYLKRFRKVILGSPEYIILKDDYYQVNHRYLDWCDALAFESLFERASRTAPAQALDLYLEIIALYRGEFLAGFELGEWGDMYRAACESRFLQAVTMAGEQLLQENRAQEALAVIQRGLAQDYFQEHLHTLAFRAYAQAGLYDSMTTHYTTLVEMFEQELGAPPAQETSQLYLLLQAEGQQSPSDSRLTLPRSEKKTNPAR